MLGPHFSGKVEAVSGYVAHTPSVLTMFKHSTEKCGPSVLCMDLLYAPIYRGCTEAGLIKRRQINGVKRGKIGQ